MSTVVAVRTYHASKFTTTEILSVTVDLSGRVSIEMVSRHNRVSGLVLELTNSQRLDLIAALQNEARIG